MSGQKMKIVLVDVNCLKAAEFAIKLLSEVK